MSRFLPDDVLLLLNSKIVNRPSDSDSNFRYVHHEDVLDIAKMSFERGKECASNDVEPAPSASPNGGRNASSTRHTLQTDTTHCGLKEFSYKMCL